jgi:calcineurin-like phosphoesterase family protein
MSASWIISDTHFGHSNILGFLKDDGTPLRSFSSVEEMDETMVKNWNDRVRPHDRIYHLGDVAMNRRCIPILGRLNGKKVLIKGNHDIFPLKDYLPYFEDIRAYKVFPKHGTILSHIPVHTCQLHSRWKLNIHGHLHGNHVGDDRYLNVCVEQTGYSPVNLDEVVK